MRNWIQRIVALLSIILAIFVHELGHFVVMNQYGVEVKTISVGLRVPFVPTLTMHVPTFPKMSIEFSPFLIGGQAEPSDAGARVMKALPMEQRVHIYAAGVKVNLFVAFLMLALSYCFARYPYTKFRRAGVVIPIITLLCIAASFFIDFCELALIPLTCLIIFSFLFFKKAKIVMGLRESFIEFREALSDVKEAPKRFAVLNISLFVINLIPLYPLDGGHIIGIVFSLISERSEYLFLRITGLIALVSISLVWVLSIWTSCKRNV